MSGLTTLLSDFKKVTHERGLLNTLKILYSTFTDLFFDLKLGLHFDTGGTLDPRELDQGNPYSSLATLFRPSRGEILKKYLRELNLPKDQVFVDIGCGKGRTLLVAYLAGWKKVKGIDLFPELIKLAESNLHKFKAQNLQFNFELIQQNAVHYIPEPEDCIFYLYDPFQDEVLQTFLLNLYKVKKEQRSICWVIYHHNFYPEQKLIQTFQFFEKVESRDVQGNRFHLFKIRP